MHVGVIGAGHMGTAILKALAESKQFSRVDLFIADSNKEKAGKIAKDLSINLCSDNLNLLNSCEVIILAVKPQDLNTLVQEIRYEAKENQLVISIAAGVELSYFDSQFKFARLARVMSNLPIVIGAGMSTFALGKNTRKEDRETIQHIFGLAGKVMEIPEHHTDISSMAFAAMPGWSAFFMDAFIDACKKHGLTEEQAELMVAQGIAGSGKYVVETKTKPSDLAKKVAVKGGVTEAGLDVLTHSDLKEVIQACVDQAMERSKELGKQVE